MCYVDFNKPVNKLNVYFKFEISISLMLISVVKS
jgi:hypothetical protein